MRIYIASSWKNCEQVWALTEALAREGHEVDAFCIPRPGRFILPHAVFEKMAGRPTSEITAKEALSYPAVMRAYTDDKKYLDWCECCVMILPSGKSSHLEAGYAKGSGKAVFIYGPLEPGGFETMYGFADGFAADMNALQILLEREKAIAEARSAWKPGPKPSPELTGAGGNPESVPPT